MTATEIDIQSQRLLCNIINNYYSVVGGKAAKSTHKLSWF